MARRKKSNAAMLPLSLLILMGIATFSEDIKEFVGSIYKVEEVYHNYDIGNIPDYESDYYIVLNNNNPYFTKSDFDYTKSFEEYSDLDSLGRVGVSVANIGTDLMPTEARGSIGQIKPSGWHTIKYDFIDGLYLYNRCHLIGYQLTGENANEKNLMTCTRNMNAKVMLEFENIVANYIKETNNHVLYRVTPLFKDDDLLAQGLEIEALSVEDDGKGVKFNVFIYNVQDGIEIDYKTGDSKEK